MGDRDSELVCTMSSFLCHWLKKKLFAMWKLFYVYLISTILCVSYSFLVKFDLSLQWKFEIPKATFLFQNSLFLREHLATAADARTGLERENQDPLNRAENTKKAKCTFYFVFRRSNFLVALKGLEKSKRKRTVKQTLWGIHKSTDDTVKFRK